MGASSADINDVSGAGGLRLDLLGGMGPGAKKWLVNHGEFDTVDANRAEGAKGRVEPSGRGDGWEEVGRTSGKVAVLIEKLTTVAARGDEVCGAPHGNTTSKRVRIQKTKSAQLQMSTHGAKSHQSFQQHESQIALRESVRRARSASRGTS